MGTEKVRMTMGKRRKLMVCFRGGKGQACRNIDDGGGRRGVIWLWGLLSAECFHLSNGHA